MSMDQTQTLENLTYTIRDALEFTLYQAEMHAEYGDGDNKPVCYETIANRLKQALGQIIGDDHAYDEYDYFVRKANRRVQGD